MMIILTISKTENLKPVDITTQVFPGFATDLQQPITALLTIVMEPQHLKKQFMKIDFKILNI
jgi:UDP-N-acetylglucosamine 1-carboxyvinyltransferase